MPKEGVLFTAEGTGAALGVGNEGFKGGGAVPMESRSKEGLGPEGMGGITGLEAPVDGIRVPREPRSKAPGVMAPGVEGFGPPPIGRPVEGEA